MAEAESLLLDIRIEEEIVPIEEYVLVDENLKDEEIQCEKEIKEVESSSESEEEKISCMKAFESIKCTSLFLEQNNQFTISELQFLRKVMVKIEMELLIQKKQTSIASFLIKK